MSTAPLNIVVGGEFAKAMSQDGPDGHELAYIVTTNERGVVKLFDATGGELVSLHTETRAQLAQAFAKLGEDMDTYAPEGPHHARCDVPSHDIAAVRRYA